MAIDMPAGPSEVAVYADETANAAFVAADLLSQRQNMGADSQVVLVASNNEIIVAVQTEIEKQLQQPPKKNIAAKALVPAVLL